MANVWSNEKIIDFINEIHSHPVLWNVATGVYKDRNAKKYVWSVVAEKFGITSDEAYKKFRSLRTYAKNEEKKKKKSGSASGKSKWFAYDAISFILTDDGSNTGLNSEHDKADVTEVTRHEEVQAMDSDSMFDSTSSVSSSKRRVFRKTKNAEPCLEKARSNKSQADEKTRSEYSCFGEHIANKLSKYDAYTRAQAEFKIMQILYECDMALCRNSAFSTQSPDTMPNKYEVAVESD